MAPNAAWEQHHAFPLIAHGDSPPRLHYHPGRGGATPTLAVYAAELEAPFGRLRLGECRCQLLDALAVASVHWWAADGRVACIGTQWSLTCVQLLWELPPGAAIRDMTPPPLREDGPTLATCQPAAPRVTAACTAQTNM